MANNLTAVVPQLLAQGLVALRENAIMPAMVNRGYETMAGALGTTIDVPIPSAIAVQDVVAGALPPNTDDIAPTSVPIPLDRWKEAPFYMTDRDMLEAMNGTIPMQASEAIKAIANEIDTYLLSLGRKFYGYHGTPGVTPFANGTTTDASAVRVLLNKQLAPIDQDARYLVMDPDAEGSALNVRAFQDASFGVGGSAILEGKIERRLGFGFAMDQNVVDHEAGTASSGTVAVVDDNAAGDTIVTLAAGAGSTLVDGDVLTFAGHSQTYVVTNAAALTPAGVPVSIAPSLQVAVNGSGSAVAVDVKDSHTMNLAFHRDAIAFATRPLEQAAQGLGSIIQTTQDPVSGLTLRIEVSREHKRTRFSYDVLYGAAVIRRELGARLVG